MNILCIELWKLSGAPNGLATEIQEFNKHDRNIRIIVIASKNSSLRSIRHLCSYYEIDHIHSLTEITKSPVHNTLLYIKSLWFVAHICNKHRIQLIHCNHYQWSFYTNPISVLLGIPTIIHLKDTYVLSGALSRYMLTMNQRATYIAVSKYVKRLFVHSLKINPNKIALIFDAPNLSAHFNITKQRILSKYNRVDKTISMVCRAVPERNIELFIDMCFLLAKRYPNIRFVHYGKTENNQAYINRLTEKSRRLDMPDFSFVPYTTDRNIMKSRYADSFLTVMTGKRIACSNAILESLAYGTPVIALRSGGNQEIMSSQKDLIARSDARLFAGAAEKYLNNKNLYVQSSLDAATVISEKYSPEIQHRKLKNLYTRLIKG
jgi:glycosyltransferase involved in cell wall biosynthesis